MTKRPRGTSRTIGRMSKRTSKRNPRHKVPQALDSRPADRLLHQARSANRLSHLADLPEPARLRPAQRRWQGIRCPSAGVDRAAWPDPERPVRLSSLRRPAVLQSGSHVPWHPRREHGRHESQESSALARRDGASADRQVRHRRSADRNLHRRPPISRHRHHPAVRADDGQQWPASSGSRRFSAPRQQSSLATLGMTRVSL